VRKFIARTACASLIASMFFACSLFKSRQPLRPPPTPTPTATPSPRPAPAPAPRHHHLRRRRHNRETVTTPETTPTPIPTPEGSPATTPTPATGLGAATPSASPTPPHPARVSISDEGADKSGIERELEQTRAALKKADANFGTLNSDDKAAYYQAWSLLMAAQKAQKQGDYLAASSLAQKAAVLSDRFNEAAIP
jgi:hypothetical protein